MDEQTAIDLANVLSLCISICFLSWAVCMFLDELRDYFIDKMKEKRRKLLEKQG